MLKVLILLSVITLTYSTAPSCKCPSLDQCSNVYDWNKDKKEVIVAVNRPSDYKLWMWDSFTTVIEWGDTLDEELMCYAHSQRKKYGIFLPEFVKTLNATSEEVTSYIRTIREDVELQHADVVALNLVNYLGNCMYAGEHVSGIYNVTSTIITGIKQRSNTKVLCVMPWQPPCYSSDCMISPVLAQLCDGLILSPESFNTYCEETCTAKATVSYSKLTIGLTEYLASGFSPSQIIIGIPWHGYNYTCERGDHIDNLTGHFVCHLKKKDNNGTMECDLEGSRQKISIAAMVGAVPEMALIDATYSKADQAPWRTDTFDTADGKQTYMTWFEDIGSLMSKYDVVTKFSIKGLVIFTANDITYKKESEQFNDHMWAWLLHSVLSRGEVSVPQSKVNMASTVAGVGIGLFILGCIFGTLISCVIFRKKKQPLRPPFSRDPKAADEYTDDDEHFRTSGMYSDHNHL